MAWAKLDRKLNNAPPQLHGVQGLVKLARGNTAVPSFVFEDVKKHIR
jgi:hypothetical protein